MEIIVDIEELDYQPEDKVINGILNYWFHDQWHEYTKEELTDMYMSEVEFFEEYVDRTYSSKAN